MRILHIYKTYTPDSYGGIEQVIQQLTASTKTLGVESRLLTVSAKNETGKVNDLLVVRTKKHFEYASCPISFHFSSEFKKHTEWADIIHYHFPWPFAEFFHLLKKPKKPILVSYHADITKQRLLKRCYQPIFRRFMQEAEAIVLASPNYQSSSTDLLPFKEKTQVIPYGFSMPKKNNHTFTHPSLPEKFMLFIGVLRYYKGLPILIDAMVDTDMHLVIIGDGPLQNELRLQVERLGLTHRVYFFGAVGDEVKWYVLFKAYAVILPSQLRAEAFGMALLEGLMFGKALISTELGSGTSFVNLHEQTGLVVPPNQALALREAMLRLWNDLELTERYGSAAQQRYHDYFSDMKMALAYHQLYHKLMR